MVITRMVTTAFTVLRLNFTDITNSESIAVDSNITVEDSNTAVEALSTMPEVVAMKVAFMAEVAGTSAGMEVAAGMSTTKTKSIAINREQIFLNPD